MLAPRPRRLVAGACAVASCAVLVDDCRATEEPAPATTGYAAIANRLQAHLGALWNEREQRYDSGPGAAVARSTPTCCCCTRSRPSAASPGRPRA